MTMTPISAPSLQHRHAEDRAVPPIAGVASSVPVSSGVGLNRRSGTRFAFADAVEPVTVFRSRSIAMVSHESRIVGR